MLEWAGALTVTMMVSLVLRLGGNRIQHLLGDRFVLAMEKLMGLILATVGTEMLVHGYRALLATL